MTEIHDAKQLPAPPGGLDAMILPLGPEDTPRMVGPFAMIARHRAPELPPGALPVDADVRPHPHIGLSAITYLLEGHVTHRDSLGNRSELGPGHVGLFTGGSGSVHSERFERLRVLGGRLDLFQLLLALPDGHEDDAPTYLHVPPEELPVDTGAGATVRWIGHPSPEVRAPLAFPTPVLLADVQLEPGAAWAPPELPARAVYVWAGEIAVGDHTVGTGQVAVLAPGASLRADSPARLLAFGGSPVGPRFLWWNYIHSSLDRIEAAKAAWRAGEVPLPPGDTESFTPAPPDDGRPLRRLAPL